jgi:hypothetical protein
MFFFVNVCLHLYSILENKYYLYTPLVSSCCWNKFSGANLHYLAYPIDKKGKQIEGTFFIKIKTVCCVLVRTQRLFGLE